MIVKSCMEAGVAEGYMEHTVENKMKLVMKILGDNNP